MMRDDYLEKIIRRGNELNLLEQASACFPARTSAIRWAVAAAFGLLVALLPAAGTAQAFAQMI